MPRPSPFLEGGLEIPVIKNFVHQNKLILRDDRGIQIRRNRRRNRRSGKEGEIEIIVESGDERDYIKDCEYCIGNEVTQTCTKLIFSNDYTLFL